MRAMHPATDQSSNATRQSLATHRRLPGPDPSTIPSRDVSKPEVRCRGKRARKAVCVLPPAKDSVGRASRHAASRSCRNPLRAKVSYGRGLRRVRPMREVRTPSGGKPTYGLDRGGVGSAWGSSRGRVEKHKAPIISVMSSNDGFMSSSDGFMSSSDGLVLSSEDMGPAAARALPRSRPRALPLPAFVRAAEAHTAVRWCLRATVGLGRVWRASRRPVTIPRSLCRARKGRATREQTETCSSAAESVTTKVPSIEHTERPTCLTTRVDRPREVTPEARSQGAGGAQGASSLRIPFHKASHGRLRWCSTIR